MNNGMKLWFDVESSFMLNHPKIWYMKIQALIIIVFVDQFFLPPFGYGGNGQEAKASYKASYSQQDVFPKASSLHGH